MGEDVFDVNRLLAVVDESDEPVFVSANVEDNQVPHKIGCIHAAADRRWRWPVGGFHNLRPTIEWSQCVRQELSEFANGATRYDAHISKFPQWEPRVKLGARAPLAAGIMTAELSAMKVFHWGHDG